MAALYAGADARRIRKHYTKAQRTALVDLVTTGRATPREAAAQFGVTESTAYYWLKRVERQRPALALIPQRSRTLGRPPVGFGADVLPAGPRVRRAASAHAPHRRGHLEAAGIG